MNKRREKTQIRHFCDNAKKNFAHIDWPRPRNAKKNMRYDQFRKPTHTHTTAKHWLTLRERETIYANELSWQSRSPKARTFADFEFGAFGGLAAGGLRGRTYLQVAQPIGAKLGRVTWRASSRRQSSSPTDQVAGRLVPVSRQRRWRVQSAVAGCRAVIGGRGAKIWIVKFEVCADRSVRLFFF